MRVEWTVTPEQFKRWRTRGILLRFVLLPAGLVMALAPMVAIRLLPMSGTPAHKTMDGSFWLAFAIFLALICAMIVPGVWRNYTLFVRRPQLLLASKGNVCPWCCKPVTQIPCVHDLSEEHSALLCEYWEATICDWKGRAGAALVALHRIAAHSKQRSRLRQRWESARSELADPTKPWFRRFVAACVLMVVPLGLWGWSFGQLTGLDFMMQGGFLLQWLGVGVTMGAFMASMAPFLAAQRSAPLRCTKCSHELPPLRAHHICAECGAELSRPGALKQRPVSTPWRPLIAMSLVGVPILVWSLVTMTGMHYSWMSSATLIAQVNGEDSMQQWRLMQELERRRLSAAETHALADALVASSSKTDTMSLQASSVMGNALMSRTLTSADAQNLLQATSGVQLIAPLTATLGERLTIPVTSSFGTNHMQLTHMRCILFSRVTVDGLPTPLTPWMIYESHAGPCGSLKIPAFTTPGRHTITLRAWSVVVPFASFKQNIPLDSSGVPVLPPGSACAEILADATINVTQADLSQPAQPPRPPAP